MKTNYRLKQVFTPGGLPTVTYVNRENSGLEKQLRSALAKGHSIICVTGSTKSGKTVLCRTVLKESGAVWLQGGRITSEEDFWSQLAHELSLPSEVTTLTGGELGTSGELGVGGSIGLGANKLTGSLKFGTNDKKSAAESNKSVRALQLSTLQTMTKSNRALVVDDFHYIEPAIQKRIVQSLKSEVFDGLEVILLAVPHRGFDPISVEKEMEGRFTQISIPVWSEEELRSIPVAGFSALNVSVNGSIVDRMISESFASPILVQNFCSELCLRNDVTATVDEIKELDGSSLDLIFEETAKQFGFPNYEKLRKGPQSRKDRQKRKYKNGSEGDVYSAILLAIGKTGPKLETTYDQIRSALRDILAEGTIPQKHEVVKALSQMTRIAKKEIEGEPILEWVQSDGKLYITDPFLLFFMKWSSQHHIGQSQSK